MNQPFIGIVSSEGYIEYYDFEVAKDNDFHHSFCLSEKGLEIYDNDETLRFVVYAKEYGNANESEVTVLGNPALDPFGKGREQMNKMAKLFEETGADLTVPVRVENHFLNTQYEDKVIGTMKSFLLK